MARPETFDFISNLGTLWAVFLGALLATAGGFTATQLEWFFERRRRERNAALFFGEVLSTLVILIKYAQDTRHIGDPYGPITMRMLRSARREIDIYDRNRESLFDLRDAEMRARVHTLVLRMTMPLDGIFDATQELGLLDAQARSPLLGEAEKRDFVERMDAVRATRDTGFDFLHETSQLLRTTVKDLEPVARHTFERIEQVVRDT